MRQQMKSTLLQRKKTLQNTNYAKKSITCFHLFGKMRTKLSSLLRALKVEAPQNLGTILIECNDHWQALCFGHPGGRFL
jgi:hypothetical protein